ncbi:MAG TPA: dihydrodipicolinate synthase family protein [Trebonia sp.]|jgi:4-hydroxy-tetrahydrodipicolinate synthase|nr:dihydrodipicolinate synthase family protein [Trebonia sp.]
MPDLVLAAVPTPFTADGDLDLATARRAYAYIADHVDGLFLAGTTGEFAALDADERLAVIEIGIEVAGPDRVIAHIGAPDSRAAARLATDAVRLGACRIAAVTPFYNAPSPTELTDYYARVRDAAPDVELYAYLFPERTGVSVPVSLFTSLASTAGLAGAKMSGSAAADVAAFAAACPGLKIYSGADADLAAVLRAGGAGTISGRAGAFPAVYGALATAIAKGDSEAIARHQADVESIVALGSSIGRYKHALRQRGFGPMTARMPVGEPDPETATRITELVNHLEG